MSSKRCSSIFYIPFREKHASSVYTIPDNNIGRTCIWFMTKVKYAQRCSTFMFCKTCYGVERYRWAPNLFRILQSSNFKSWSIISLLMHFGYGRAYANTSSSWTLGSNLAGLSYRAPPRMQPISFKSFTTGLDGLVRKMRVCRVTLPIPLCCWSCFEFYSQ